MNKKIMFPIMLIILIMVILTTLELAATFLFPLKGQTFTEDIISRENIEKTKLSNEKRIFIFGGSSVIGYHHLGKSNIGIALRFILQEKFPDIKWTVVNFGKAGEASRFIFDVASESLKYNPDLIIIYTGENEFSPIPILRRKLFFRLEWLLLKSKFFRVIIEYFKDTSLPSVPSFSKFPQSDVLKLIHNNKSKIKDEFNNRIMSFVSKTNVPVVFVIPVVNVKWGPSFHDEIHNLNYDNNNPMTEEFLRSVYYQLKGNYDTAADGFHRIIQQNPSIYDAHFRLGECLQKMGKPNQSHEHFLKAFELDIILRRIQPKLANFNDDNFIVLNVPHLLTLEKNEIIDFNYIEDDVHPNINTEFKIAKFIQETGYFIESLNISEPNQTDYSFKKYLKKIELTNKVLSKIYLSIGKYHNGRQSGSIWFEKALRLNKNDPDIMKEYSKHLNKYHQRKIQVLSAIHNWIQT